MDYTGYTPLASCLIISAALNIIPFVFQLQQIEKSKKKKKHTNATTCNTLTDVTHQAFKQAEQKLSQSLFRLRRTWPQCVCWPVPRRSVCLVAEALFSGSLVATDDGLNDE